MLERRRHCEPAGEAHLARLPDAPGDPALQHIVQPLPFQLGVVLRMQVAVRRLLADEAAHLFAQLGRFDQGQRVAHAVDEELLALREGHRGGVEQLAAKRIAAVSSHSPPCVVSR